MTDHIDKNTTLSSANGVASRSRFHPLWVAWLNQRRRWVPTLVLIPALYGLGWLVMQPIAQLIPDLSIASRDLLGTTISLLLFLMVLPSWVRIRWSTRHPWRQLGLNRTSSGPKRSRALLRGFRWAVALLVLISLISLGGQWAYWLGDLPFPRLINALLLCFGVGLA